MEKSIYENRFDTIWSYHAALSTDRKKCTDKSHTSGGSERGGGVRRPVNFVRRLARECTKENNTGTPGGVARVALN